MDRPRAPRPRPTAVMQAPAQAPVAATWSVTKLVGGVLALTVIGAASIVAYRFMSGPRTQKKSRSKHGKKEKSKKKSEVDVVAPTSQKAGSPPSSRTPPPARAASPPAMAKPVADSSRLDQLAWWVEIAKDQFESRSLKHAAFYANKALVLGEQTPDFEGTFSHCFLRFILAYVTENRDLQLGELKDIRIDLTKLEATEGQKKEFLMFKARVVAALADQFIKRKTWEEAEAHAQTSCDLFEAHMEGSEDARNSTVGIQKYQLCVVKKNLKKLDEALAAAEQAYEYIIKSKMRAEFSSAIARQRADILDALGRFPEAKAVVLDHLERLEALPVVAANPDDPQSQPPPPTNRADNLLFLARLHFEHGEYDEAIKLLKSAHEIVPSPYYLSLLAGAQFEAGLTEDALNTQTQLRRSRISGEFPISSSKLLITRVFSLRQKKLDGPWTFDIELELKTTNPMGTDYRTAAGSIIEAVVRRHYETDEVAPVDAPKPSGPFRYTVTGTEVDGSVKLKGLVSKCDPMAVYEIVITILDGTTKEKLGVHRQLARANSYTPRSRYAALGEGSEFDDEEMDDYALPETVEELIEEDAAAAEDEEIEEIMADEATVAHIPTQPNSHEADAAAAAASNSNEEEADRIVLQASLGTPPVVDEESARAEERRLEDKQAAMAEAARVEAEKQAEVAKQAEAEKQAEIAKQAEAARIEAEKLEAARKEAEEAARLAELEAQKQEEARKAAEIEAEKQAEIAKQEEAARIEAEKQAEAAKAEAARVEAEKLEAARKEAEEAACLAELEAQKQEEAKKAEEAEAARVEAEKQAAAAAAAAEAEKSEEQYQEDAEKVEPAEEKSEEKTEEPNGESESVEVSEDASS